MNPQQHVRARLAQRAYEAIKIIEDANFKQRAKSLELIGERGFALILYWNKIEVALKLTRYGDFIKDGWPDKLDFLRASWKPLHRLRKDCPVNYELVFSGSCNSLWKTRNKIAHEGHIISIEEYSRYHEAALWAITKLLQEIPNLERLREKKRHSDAQLARRA